MNDPHQKPWRIWYSADNGTTWRATHTSAPTYARAIGAATEEVGPRLLRQLQIPLLAVCAIHAGTKIRSDVYYVRPEQAIEAERPVVAKIYHGKTRALTMAFGYVTASELQRHVSTQSPITLRRFVGIANTLPVEQAAIGAPGRVVGDEVPAAKLRNVVKIAVCTAEATREWEHRKKFKAVRDAIDRLACSKSEREQLIEILYQEDLGTRLETEGAPQIAEQRLEWLRRETQ